jgi:hypothetical protein
MGEEIPNSDVFLMALAPLSDGNRVTGYCPFCLLKGIAKVITVRPGESFEDHLHCRNCPNKPVGVEHIKEVGL